MNYINEDKNYKTQEEWIKYLEESVRELRKEKENLNKEKGRLKARLEEENKRLQSALDYANRDRESMHYKIVELGNKRESQKKMNYKLREQNKNLKDVGHVKKITELKKELNILKLRVEHNDAIIDELLVAEEGTDIQGILEKEYDFSYFN